MNVTSDVLIIKAKNDATPELMEQLKAEGGCAGKFHVCGDFEFPCMGDGYLVKKFEQRRYACTHEEHNSAVGLLEDAAKNSYERSLYGEPNPNAVVETVVCVPTLLAPCPCKTAARHSEFDLQVLKELGFETLPKLYDNQKAAVASFKKEKANLFIYGENSNGKTTCAAACALGFHRRVKVLVGNEISTEWTRRAFDKQDLDYEGLLILDDIDKVPPTDSFKDKVWYILDRVIKKKLRLIITTNMTPQRFAETYSTGVNDLGSTITRLSKFESVKI